MGTPKIHAHKRAVDGEDSLWGRGTLDVQESRGAVILLPLLFNLHSNM